VSDVLETCIDTVPVPQYANFIPGLSGCTCNSRQKCASGQNHWASCHIFCKS